MSFPMTQLVRLHDSTMSHCQYLVSIDNPTEMTCVANPFRVYGSLLDHAPCVIRGSRQVQRQSIRISVSYRGLSSR